jgi:hypothetical protein
MIHARTGKAGSAPRRGTPGWVLGVSGILLVGASALARGPLFTYLATLYMAAAGSVLFLVVWQSPATSRDPFFAMIGLTFLGVSALETAHGAASLGALDFLRNGAAAGPGLDDAARLLEALGLCVAALFLMRALRRRILLAAFGIVFTAAVATALAMAFPAPAPAAAFANAELLAAVVLAACLLLLTTRRAAVGAAPFTLIAAVAARIAADCLLLLAGSAGPWRVGAAVLGCGSLFLLCQAAVSRGARDEARGAYAAAPPPEAQRPELNGLIPVCMHCKRVRVSETEWQQIEAYVAARSRAAFSHGICPECAQQVFGELERSGAGGAH